MSRQWPNDGRINLEQLRKRAKALLRGLKAGVESTKIEQLRKVNPNAELNLPCASRCRFSAIRCMKLCCVRLYNANTPLITESDTGRDWHQRPLSLTELGQRVLAGQAYWIDYAPADKWVGGVRIVPSRAHWAIDEQGHPIWRKPN